MSSLRLLQLEVCVYSHYFLPRTSQILFAPSNMNSLIDSNKFFSKIKEPLTICI